MQSHETKKTVSLNGARSGTIAMSKAMCQTLQLTEMVTKEINDGKDQCKMADADFKKLRKNRTFKALELKITHHDSPGTVCSAIGCKKYVPLEPGQREAVYPQICHDRCDCVLGVAVATTNIEELRDCSVLSGGNCSKYGHDYRPHMHLSFTNDLVEKDFRPEILQDLIEQKSFMKVQSEEFITRLEGTIKELEEEKNFIYECASLFFVFLKDNSTIVYKDSFSEYLDMLIKEEEAKEEEIRDDKIIEQLKNERRAYEEKKNVIVKDTTTGCKDNNEAVTIEKVNQMRTKLCSLKHNGKTLKMALGIYSALYKAFTKFLLLLLLLFYSNTVVLQQVQDNFLPVGFFLLIFFAQKGCATDYCYYYYYYYYYYYHYFL